MERLIALAIFVLVACLSCKQQEANEKPIVIDEFVIDEEAQNQKLVSEVEAELKKAGYMTFNYVDEETKDTVIMQQYFIAFLKRGPNRDQPKEVADSLQKLHLEHLGRMYDLGYADISGPFGDDGDIRGITIYNTPTQHMADSLANLDPMVKAGRLSIEIHPWWAAKGFPLR